MVTSTHDYNTFLSLIYIYIYISLGQWPVQEGDKEINTASVSVVEWYREDRAQNQGGGVT